MVSWKFEIQEKETLISTGKFQTQQRKTDVKDCSKAQSYPMDFAGTATQ